MIMVDRGGSIVHANHEAEKLFGYSTGRLVGQSIEMLVPIKKRADHPAHRKNYINKPTARRMGGLDLLAQNIQGKVFPVEVRLNPIDTPDGIVVLCSIIDLTERKNSENMILEQAKQLKAANALLAEQATTDSLTKLANRRSMSDRLETLLRLSRRNGRPISVLLADIDHFKKYNDDLGHRAGDGALITVAQTLKNTARGTDFVARYGGEEFAILLPETDHHEALVAGEKFRSTVEAISGLERNVTISLGATTLKIEHDSSFDVEMIENKLIEQADQALYYSKKSGRNRITHFNDIGEVS